MPRVPFTTSQLARRVTQFVWGTLIPAALRTVSIFKSVQSGTLSINAGSSTGTSAITSVDAAKALIIPCGGHNSAAADANFNLFFNSGTQLGANRVGTSGNTIIRYIVAEPW